uniref:Piwi domain-containing protein n=1 Tax=Strongyloides papillosus TaxID=174720 RepID=A0A0N5BV46_STREA
MINTSQFPFLQLPRSDENFKNSDDQSLSELFKQLNIVEGTGSHANIKNVGHTGVGTNIITNCFQITGKDSDVKSHVYQFDPGIFFTVMKKDGQTARVEFNKAYQEGFKVDDYCSQTLKVIIIKLFPFLEHISKQQLGIPEKASISGFHRLFFTVDEELKKHVESQKGVWRIEVPGDLVSYVQGASLECKFATDFSYCLFEESVNSKQEIQYINLIIKMKSHMSFEDWTNYQNGRSYLIAPEKHGVREADIPLILDEKCLGIESFSSVRQSNDIERNDSGFICVVNSIKTAFHAPQLLNEKVDELLKRIGPSGRIEKVTFHGQTADKVLKNLKGLVCHCIHLNRKEIKIESIDNIGADSRRITVGNETMTVQEYFLKTHNIALRFHQHPLIVQKTKRFENGKKIKGFNYYPMELLEVADYQRVSQKAQTPDQIKAMIKACATNPANRINDIRRLFGALQVTRNDFLHYLNLKVQETPKSVTGRMLESPKISYANNRIVNAKPDNKSWDIGYQDQFVIPSRVVNWGCYYFEPVGMGKITYADIKQFVDAFTRQARQRGVFIENCYEIKQIPQDEMHLKDLFVYLQNEKTDFALFLTPDTVTDMHQYIKLFERIYGVTTQDIKHGTVKNVIFKKQFKTLDNIIMKTNVKVGGLNYQLINSERQLIVDKNKLIIGIGFNHTKSGGSDTLSTVGFAANTTKNPTEFVGDVCFTTYQTDGKVTFYTPIIETVMGNYFKSNNEPSEIIIYRTSGSEGRYDEYLRWEVPFIKHLLQFHAPSAKLTFIVVEKNHNLRFFKEDIDARARAPGQNVVPGTVVDNGIVRTKVCEFYLTSHSGLQGTAKTPRYAILYDENNYTMDEIQNLTNGLAYDYQIVNLPISLPAPVYIANQYADRGRMTLKASEIEFSAHDGHEKAYDTLGYKNSPFNNKRVNA